MKRILLIFIAFSSFIVSNYAVNNQNWKIELQSEIEGITPEMTKGIDLNKFLDLTPAKYKEMTGKKLGFLKTFQLKQAQKFLKKRMNSNEDGSTKVPEGLYIIGSVLAFGWLLMGLMDDFQGSNWWVSLILYLLCILPGIIHAFVKKNEYY